VDPSENGLLRRAVDGDADALSELLREHGPAARRSIAGRIPQRWQSVLSEDDVMQQTYADAFRGIAAFRTGGGSSFAAWLTNLARCNMADALKELGREKRGGSRQRVHGAGSEDSYAALYEQLSSGSTTPSRRAARNEARTALERAVGQLPETYQTVVRMYDLEGQTVEDVAAKLSRSPGAVYMLRARAHQRLGELLGSASGFLSGSP
jgi:RNA polymerase sigma-70 factor (subfamily 1)